MSVCEKLIFFFFTFFHKNKYIQHLKKSVLITITLRECQCIKLKNDLFIMVMMME